MACPAGCIRPAAVNSVIRALFGPDHLLFGLRGVSSRCGRVASSGLAWPSIQPKQVPDR